MPLSSDDRFFAHVGILLALVFIDQAAKLLVQRFLDVGQSVRVLFFDIRLVSNTGASFGILSSYPFMLLVIALVALVLCFSFYARFPNYRLLIIIIAAGIVGNVVDRFLYGFVVDFIDLPFFPAVFNIADMMIFFGIFILIFLLWNEDTRRKRGNAA